MQTLNVIDTAIRSGIFQTFTRLLEGSPLEQRLRGQESFTLFAPVDISFAYLPTETFDLLLKAENTGILFDVPDLRAVFSQSTRRRVRERRAQHVLIRNRSFRLAQAQLSLA